MPTSRSAEADHGVVIENQWHDDWIKDMPDQAGKVAIVTGANSGTGFWAANALASKGCMVVLACRNESKANAAKAEILTRFPKAKLDVIVLGNVDLSTVRSFVKTFDNKHDRLDYLLNNAGAMAQPLIKSKDGHDVQFQTNHLSHFLLTQLLWEKIVKTPGQSRIVHHSSSMHSLGSARFDVDHVESPKHSWGFFGINVLIWNTVLPLMGASPCGNWACCGMSKLCNMLFVKEMARNIESEGLQERVIALSCHPGHANTNLQNVAKHSMSNWEKSNAGNAQSAADGSLPLLMATISKNVKNGDFAGPKDCMKGPPIVTHVGGNGGNKKMARELWTCSEKCIAASFSIQTMN